MNPWLFSVASFCDFQVSFQQRSEKKSLLWSRILPGGCRVEGSGVHGSWAHSRISNGSTEVTQVKTPPVSRGEFSLPFPSLPNPHLNQQILHPAHGRQGVGVGKWGVGCICVRGYVSLSEPCFTVPNVHDTLPLCLLLVNTMVKKSRSGGGGAGGATTAG